MVYISSEVQSTATTTKKKLAIHHNIQIPPGTNHLTFDPESQDLHAFRNLIQLRHATQTTYNERTVVVVASRDGARAGIDCPR